ncbi:hypothetical protein N0V86_007841 [Didymella sp. IMI 355093]|nr:hypothetical protein N0V86_007841 [Didymella sp. IMI 355093]
MLDQLYSKQHATIHMKSFPCVGPRRSHPVFGWIRSLYLTIELERGWRHNLNSFKKLYALHLDDLQLLLQGEPKPDLRYPGISILYGDLTTVGPPMLATPSSQLEPIGADVVVNCNKIVLTLDHLANGNGARDKQTTCEVAFKGTNQMYLFTVIQNKEGQQIERSYTFDTRFETPTPLPPHEVEEEGHHGECAIKHVESSCKVCEEFDELSKSLCMIS